MAIDWEIKSRGDRCTLTGRPFADGDVFYTLLYRERGGGFRREDLSEEAWRQRDSSKPPFSFWKSTYEVPPAVVEPLAKQTAEDLLRQLLAEPGDQHANVRYILGLMLERKRILKPIETKEAEGERLLIYEHRASGEVFVIPDPRLHLDQIEAVQIEVAQMLTA